MSPMRGPLPSYRPAFPSTFLKQAEKIVRHRTVKYQLRQRATLVLLLDQQPVWPKYSCGLVVVVFQEPPEPLSALDWPFTIIGRLPGTKRNHIAESLMTTFLVVMLDVLAQHMTQ